MYHTHTHTALASTGNTGQIRTNEKQPTTRALRTNSLCVDFMCRNTMSFNLILPQISSICFFCIKFEDKCEYADLFKAPRDISMTFQPNHMIVIRAAQTSQSFLRLLPTSHRKGSGGRLTSDPSTRA